MGEGLLLCITYWKFQISIVVGRMQLAAWKESVGNLLIHFQIIYVV